MENSKILKIIGSITAVVGAVVTVIGVNLRNEAQSMLSALESGANLFGYESSTYRGMSSWGEHLQTGNIVLAVGLVLLVVGAVVFFVGYLKGNEAQHPERAKIASIDNSETTNTAAKLRELNELKDQGIISEEEYNAKRQEIINRI